MAEETTPALTGKQYADFGKTDAATVIGLRVAIHQTALAIKRAEEKGEIDPNHRAEEIKKALAEAVDDNKYLRAAGTGELVKKYFDNVIGSDDAKAKKFLDALPDSAALESALQKYEKTGEVNFLFGLQMQRASSILIGNKTLTNDFQDRIKKEEVYKGVSITPSAMDKETAKSINDKLNDLIKFDKNPLSGAPVNGLWARIDPNKEESLKPIIEAATRLSKGETDDLAAQRDMKLIKEALTGKKEEKLPDVSQKDGQKIGQQLLNTIVRARAEEVNASPENLMLIIDSKGEKVPEQKPQGHSQNSPGNSLGILGEFIVSAVENLVGKENVGELLAMLNPGSAPSSPSPLAQNISVPPSLPAPSSTSKFLS